MIHITYYGIVCTTEGCDWSVCWFGADPWADGVCCPYHPGKMQVSGRNRPGDPVWIHQRTLQFSSTHENAYSSTKVVPKVPFPSFEKTGHE